MEYDLVYTRIAGTSLTLNNEVAIGVAGIMDDDLLEWLVLLVELGKRLCSSFDECVIMFYECFFTRIGLRFPFSDFEVAILKYLKVSPS